MFTFVIRSKIDDYQFRAILIKGSIKDITSQRPEAFETLENGKEYTIDFHALPNRENRVKEMATNLVIDARASAVNYFKNYDYHFNIVAFKNLSHETNYQI